MDDLRDEFIAETRETLETLAGELINWEKNPADHALIDSVFRFFHTVKGSCGFLDLPRLERLSHAAEDLLSAARDNRLQVNEQLVSAVLAVIDRISELTDALENGASVHDNDGELIEAMLQFHPDNILTELGVPQLGVVATALEVDGAFMDQSFSKSRTVRVSLQQLDKLMNGVSDLVLARNELSRQLRAQGISNELEHAFARLSGSVAEIRDSISVVRMQPIDRLFSGVPRLLRDTCVELGKEIDFTIEGGDVEIDREMVESLRDPLTHIIRNAADHGIESPSDRVAIGKSPKGEIRISARQAGNQIAMDISDDGRGISMEKLRNTAIARKLVNPQQWNALDDDRRLALIFAPGFSTAETVTAISGRGVGMDVVRTNLEAVGATINLKNEEGQGFTISLLLPLTLSIIAGLSVKAGGQTFALSRTSIVEILSVNNNNVAIEEIGGAKMAKVRETRYLYSKLEDILGIEEKSQAWNSRSLVIIRPVNGEVFALDVEAVTDTEELVVKPCAAPIMAAGLYAGTTLPDNGKPMLLLDVSGLAAAIGTSGTKDLSRIRQTKTAVAEDAETKGAISILYFETMEEKPCALPLSIVERMEDIAVGQIFSIAGRQVVHIDEKSWPLIGNANIADQDSVKMLRLSDGVSTKYLAIADVIDILTAVPDRSFVTGSSAIEGIVHVNGAPIELLSPYHLFSDGAGFSLETSTRPLCFVEAGENDGWERSILAPMLLASGYAVSFEIADRDKAAVILQRDAVDSSSTDHRTIVLKDNIAALDPNGSGQVYRYDERSLMSEIKSIVGKAL
jgi:two-component system, chemotaxis family, sensor kinase CheA